MPACRSIAIVLGAALAAAAHGQTIFTETEPNNTRATANGPFLMAAGDQIQGNVQGPNGFDYFKVTPVPAPLGIYKYSLTVTSSILNHLLVTSGYSQIDGAVNYRGSLLESNGVIASSATPLGGTPPRTAVWYAFGRSEALNFRVQSNVATTTADYFVTMNIAPVTPTDLGTMPGGVVTITTVGQGHTTNTAMWVFDSNYNSMPDFGNDDVPDPLAHTVLQSTVTREMLTPGDYYLALSNSQLMVDRECPDPPADRQPNTPVSDPGTVLCTSTAVNQNCAFAITDGAGVVHQFPATKTDGFQVLWFKFTIAAPATGSCCKPDGTCVTASQGGCTSLLGGTYGGDGTDCSGASCTQPPLGACCQLDGTCIQATQYACTSYSGAWHGAGSACTAHGCPATVGRGDSGVYTPLSAGAQQGGLVFDVTTGSSAITVSRFDIFCVQAYNNAPSTNPMEFFIFNRTPLAGDSGSYVGYEGNSLNPGGNGIPPTNLDGTPAWAQNTYVTGLGTPGNWQTIPITLATPVTIPANSTLGFYIASHGGGLGWFNGGDTTFTGPSGVTMTTSTGRSFAFQAAPGWGTNTQAAQASFNGRMFYSVAPSCGSADFNCDGDIGTDSDIESFFACLSGSCPAAPCMNSADFNGDGDIGTDSDIEAFFRVLSGGSC
jgi:hypothetical protein